MTSRIGLVAAAAVVLLAAALNLPAWLSAAPQAAAPQGSTPDALMGAAQYLEEVQGKPADAIAAYKKVLAAPGVSRALAARAQFRIGACYEKLGQADARRAYDEVVRKFVDQPELVRQAQARLAALTATPHPQTVGDGPVPRPLFRERGKDLPSLNAIVSPDGRYIAFERGPQDDDIVVRDLATGEVRGLLHGACSGPVVSSWSGDSRRLSFQCTPANDRTATEVRVVDLAGSPSRLVYSTKGHPDDVALSPDGATTYVLGPDGASARRLLAVSTADGTARSLWEGRDFGAGAGMRVSPDGRYVAFETTKAASRLDWDIWVVPVRGGDAVPAAQTPLSERLVDWAPDAAGIVAAVEDSTNDELRLIGFREGTIGAASTLRAVLPNLRSHSARITNGGMLVGWVGKTKQELLLAEIDEAAGRLSSRSAPTPVAVAGGNHPAWSPDGTSLAYIAQRPGSTQSQLVIFTVSTGQTRTFPVPGSPVLEARWSPDGRWLTHAAMVLGTTGRLFRTNTQTGETSELPNTTGISQPHVTFDGKLAFYRGRDGVMVRDLATGNGRVVRPGRVIGTSLSPDEKWIAVNESVSPNVRTVSVMPVGGGESKELFRSQPGSFLYTYVDWSADSQRVFIIESVPGEGLHYALWALPIDGQAPVRTDLGSSRPPGGFSVHPNGKTVALTNTTSDPPEVWAVENFLPAAKTAPKAGAVK